MTETSIEWVNVLVPVGAALSGVALGNWLEKKHHTDQQREQSFRQKNAIALSLLVKIKLLSAWLSSVREALDQFFIDANEADLADLEPVQFVDTIIHPSGYSPSVEAPELALLLETGDDGLVEEVLALFSRTQVALELLAEHRKRRTAFEEFMDEIAVSHETLDGVHISTEIPGASKGKLDRLTGQANAVIGLLSEHLDDDVPRAKEILTRVSTAVSSVEGVTVTEGPKSR